MQVECLAQILEQTECLSNLAPTVSCKQNAVRKKNTSLMARTKPGFSSYLKCMAHCKFSVSVKSVND